jgi:hypothetical protein
MKKYIQVKFSLEGFHCWPEAAIVFPQVSFLSHPHRHLFYFTAVKEVNHNDRDIEIIMFKRELMSYITTIYFNQELNACDFGRRSCEDLAQEILTTFGCHSVTVLEDNENGAILIND